jgi:hypothetical protein
MKSLPAIFAVSLIFFAVTQQAFAITLPVDPSIATASSIAPSAIINDDLKPHVWSAHPTLGYFSGTTTVDGAGATAENHGFGGTGEVQYSSTEHIGIIFSAMGYSGSGTYTPGTSETGALSGNSNVRGWLVGAALVLDPFSGPGFRLPFFFGLNYQHLSSSTPSSPIITAMTLNSPGYTFGFSPRFNLGFLRVEPFLVVTTALNQGNVTCAADVVSGACGALAIQTLPVYGINLLLLPWNISFYFNLSTFLSGIGVSFYSAGPRFTF